MSDINNYLQSLAFKNAKFYTRDQNLKSILLGGSISINRATRYSDIDTIIIYDKVPPREFIEEAVEHNAGHNWKLISESEGGYVDSYYVNGVECQFSHGLASWYEDIINKVLVDFSLDRISHLVLDGLSQAIPVHGKRYHNTINKRIDNYPRELAVKLVEEHMKFPPMEEVGKRLFQEDSLLRFYDVVIKLQKNILGILIGLNHMFIPGDYKKLDSLAKRMKLKPDNLSSRINEMFCRNPSRLTDDLESLIIETLDLVEENLPEIDTGPVRKMVNRKLKPITMHN